MKLKKRKTIVLSLLIGSTMFASTVLAEINSKNGYEQGKDILKYTAAQLYDGGVQSYTMERQITMKDNDKIIQKESSINKVDTVNRRIENNNIYLDNDRETTNYQYTEPMKMISYSSYNDSYYIQQYDQEQEYNYLGSNPFKEQYASDFERIADSVVGNLKDYAVVSEKADGTKELSGSIDETQIPALVNAISSYAMKQRLSTTYDEEKKVNVERVLKDIFIKNVQGNAQVSKAGMLESLTIDSSIVAKDDKEQLHTFTLQVVIKLKDINSTVVNAPDLTGKTTETHAINNKGGVTSAEKVDIGIYKGTYKNDIMLLKDNKIVKIGERVLEITDISEEKVKAKYNESYLEGYEEYKKSAVTVEIEEDLAKYPDNNPSEKYYSISIEFQYGQDGRRGYFGFYEPSIVSVNLDKFGKESKDIISNSTLVRVLN